MFKLKHDQLYTSKTHNLNVCHSIKVYRINVLACFCGSSQLVETRVFQKQVYGEYFVPS